jgi:4-carboxymuconolactone decarboxylase
VQQKVTSRFGGNPADRQAQVVGEPPRIEPVAPDAMNEVAHGLIRQLNGSLGAETPSKLPEYFRTMVKHPSLFRCQLETGTAIFTGAIPARERELAVLRVAWLCGAPYAWGEHVALAKRFGISSDEIERVTDGSSASGWSEHESAILRGVEELLDDQAITDATWNRLAQRWDEKQLIEFPTMVGAYVATAFQQNALRMRLGPDNAGLTAR